METSYTNRISDEFDVYFKRAAQLDHLTSAVHHRLQHDQQQQQQAEWRRDSSRPDRRSSSTERRRVSSSGSVRHKRTSSCRYPQRRPAVTVTRDVTVTNDQLLSSTEHTPLTAGSHRARVNDHRLLGEYCVAIFRQYPAVCSNWLRLITVVIMACGYNMSLGKRKDPMTVVRDTIHCVYCEYDLIRVYRYIVVHDAFLQRDAAMLARSWES